MRRVLVGIAVVTMLAIGMPPAVAVGAAQTDGMRLVRTRTSLLGTHRWYQQTYQGVDVLDGLVAEHSYRGGGSSKDDRRKPVTDSPSVTPSVSAAQARARAGAGSQEPTLAVLAGAPSRLVWSVAAQVPGGATRTLVDARNGSVVEVRRTEQRAEGTGTVFDPNPRGVRRLLGGHHVRAGERRPGGSRRRNRFRHRSQWPSQRCSRP
jgi:hypothetical protein